MLDDYYDLKNSNFIELDCGRSAIQYIIEVGNYKRVWIPAYNCPSVFNRLSTVSSLSIMFYNINSSFLPDIRENSPERGDLIVWINYWGCMKNETIQSVLSYQTQMGVDILFDNSVAFFAPPIEAAYNVYSCRKFIGVADGAYIKGRKIEKVHLKEEMTSDNYLFLLKATEQGSNSAYNDYLNNEKRFDKRGKPYAMSKLTKSILKKLDYDSIKNKRKRNFLTLHSILGSENKLDVNYSTDTAFVYPLFTRSEFLRKRLLDRHIYVSQHWKHVLQSDYSNEFEKQLAMNTIPLPIDQRYSEEQMTELAHIVLKLNNEG